MCTVEVAADDVTVPDTEDVMAKQATVTGDLGEGQTFTMIAYLIKSNGTVGTEARELYRGMLKFSIEVSGVPACDAAGSSRLGVSFLTDIIMRALTQRKSDTHYYNNGYTTMCISLSSFISKAWKTYHTFSSQVILFWNYSSKLIYKMATLSFIKNVFFRRFILHKETNLQKKIT